MGLHLHAPAQLFPSVNEAGELKEDSTKESRLNGRHCLVNYSKYGQIEWIGNRFNPPWLMANLCGVVKRRYLLWVAIIFQPPPSIISCKNKEEQNTALDCVLLIHKQLSSFVFLLLDPYWWTDVFPLLDPQQMRKATRTQVSCARRYKSGHLTWMRCSWQNLKGASRRLRIVGPHTRSNTFINA